MGKLVHPHPSNAQAVFCLVDVCLLVVSPKALSKFIEIIDFDPVEQSFNQTYVLKGENKCISGGGLLSTILLNLLLIQLARNIILRILTDYQPSLTQIHHSVENTDK